MLSAIALVSVTAMAQPAPRPPRPVPHPQPQPPQPMPPQPQPQPQPAPYRPATRYSELPGHSQRYLDRMLGDALAEYVSLNMSALTDVMRESTQYLNPESYLGQIQLSSGVRADSVFTRLRPRVLIAPRFAMLREYQTLGGLMENVGFASRLASLVQNRDNRDQQERMNFLDAVVTVISDEAFYDSVRRVEITRTTLGIVNLARPFCTLETRMEVSESPAARGRRQVTVQTEELCSR